MNESQLQRWDAVIIGGGAGGLSAAVVLARAQYSVLVVDGGAPRNAPAAHMHGYLSRDGMPPGEFLATGRAEATGYGARIVTANATGADHEPDGTFTLRLDDGQRVHARSVLVATGMTDELPAIPGLAERWASTVHHCPHCHGYEVRGQSIVVLGTPAEHLSKHLAALMRRYSESVRFVVNGVDLSSEERTRLTAYGVRLVDGNATKVTSGVDDPLLIELDNGETLGCEAIFVAPRPVPHDAVLTALGAATDSASGFVAVDGSGATDIPGLWAAGNVVNPRAQVIAAAGAGATAAITMSAWLLERELSDGFGPGPSSPRNRMVDHHR